MSEHIHEFKPDVAPDYRCECGAIGRRKNGAVVLVCAAESNVLDTSRLWNMGPLIYKRALQWSNTHVSKRDEEEDG